MMPCMPEIELIAKNCRFYICGLTSGIVVGVLAGWLIGRMPRQGVGGT
jgi:F0F1-type ATP synthase assembly protein I